MKTYIGTKIIEAVPAIRKGIFAGDGAGNYGWQKPITREATAQIIYNLLEAAGMLEKLPDVK